MEDFKLTMDLLKVGLGAAITLGGVVVSLILYIWGERKKQIDNQQETQAKFNETLSGELVELKTQNLRLEDGLMTVNETMGGLKRWLVQNEKDHKAIEKDITRIDTDIKNIKDNARGK